MERNAAPGGSDAGPSSTVDQSQAIAGSSIESVDDWSLAEHLAPVDRLLRELSKIEPPECPDGLCTRTLDRCRTRIIGG